MMVPATALNGLKRQRPEWEPWLALVEEILREAQTPAWDTAVPSLDRMGLEAAVPLLAGAAVSVQTNSVRRLLERLIRIASRSGTPKMATLESALNADLDVLILFEASVCQDGARLMEVAARMGVDGEAFQAVIALASVPFLYACNRSWASSISQSWVEGYCPVCGSWPAFAEVRGIDRTRYFRCGRCGGEWHARSLHCPYCANTDHDGLVSLKAENTDSAATIEACQRCLGYVKTFTRLQGCSPGTVMLEDLGSVALDIAALEHGYSRTPGAGYTLQVTVRDGGARRRLFAWNA